MRKFIYLLTVVLVGCQNQTPSPLEINEVLDKWHRDAANGELEAYFDAIGEDGFFLGTDKTEVWSKDVFYDFSKPHFVDGKAWDFTSSDRNVMFTNDGKTAWFNEILDTWMGPCRGSGVLILTNEGWKIQQYNLAVLVDNDDIDDYVERFIKKENE